MYSPRIIKRETPKASGPKAEQESSVAQPTPGHSSVNLSGPARYHTDLHLRDSSSQQTTTPTTSVKREPAGVMSFYTVKKRSPSPGPSRIPLGVPSFGGGYEGKRVKAGDGDLRAQLPPTWEKKGGGPQQKKEPQQLKKNWQKPNPGHNQNHSHRNKNANKQPFRPPNPPPVGAGGSIARSATRPGRELESWSRKPRAPGYVFVPSGNVYITRNCKRLTLESGRDLWKVENKKGNGIHVPLDVYEAVLESEEATRESRKGAIDKIDKKEKNEARECLVKLFPNVPQGEDDIILGRAWERSSGRVGRTSKLSLEQKVRKAVVAHVRHAHTSYDQRLREEFMKNGRERVPEGILQKVRNETWNEVNAVIRSWGQYGPARLAKWQGNKRKEEEPNKARRRGPEKQSQGTAREKLTNKEKRWKKKFEKKEQKKLRRRERRRAKRALQQAQQQQEDTKGKGKAQPVQFIIIDSDSEDDAVANNLSGKGVVVSGRSNNSVRVIDLQGSDSEMEDDGEDAECWDIGEEDDDGSLYEEETDDEDYMGSGNDPGRPGLIRYTRSKGLFVPEEDRVMGENDEGEDGVSENEEEDTGSQDSAEKQVHMEDVIQAGGERNRGEVELDYGCIGSTYQDLPLSDSVSSAQSPQAETVIQKQAEDEMQREEEMPTEPGTEHTAVRSKDAMEIIYDYNQPNTMNLQQEAAITPTEDQAKKDYQKEEGKFKTEVEEAEEELYRDFGFGNDEEPYLDAFDIPEIAIEKAVIEEGAAEVVKVKQAVGAEEDAEIEMADVLEDKQDKVLVEEQEAKLEEMPQEVPELKPDEIIPDIEPKDESAEEEFVKQEYRVGGYIVEEFVRVKCVKAEKESLTAKRPLERMNGSEQGTSADSDTSRQTNVKMGVNAKGHVKAKFALPVRSWALPPEQ